MPKIELHLHLEGAIPPATLWELMLKYGEHKHIGSLKNLEDKLRYRNFANFIDTWIWIGNFLREYEDYLFIAEKVAHDLMLQNIRYAEIFYSPLRDSAKHLDVAKITEAVLAGFRKSYPNKMLQLIADMIRDNGPEEGFTLLHEIREMKDMGVVGIGLGGSEQNYPPDPFREVFEKARRFGFKTTAHAGESAGPSSIWGALKILRVDRIGHGLRAMEDHKLVEYLKKIRMPLEMCPTSNLRTGTIKKIEDHPIKKFLDEGLVVFVNSDDPKMFNTSITQELATLVSSLDFTLADIERVTRNAIQAAWCNPATKETLEKELSIYFSSRN